MISKLLGAASPFKIYIIIGLVVSLGGFIMWYDNARFDAGYNAAKAEQLEVTVLAVADAEARLKKKYDKVIAQKTKERQAALKLAATLRKKKPEVIFRDISKVNESSDCKHLGNEFVRVFNNIVGTEPGKEKP